MNGVMRVAIVMMIWIYCVCSQTTTTTVTRESHGELASCEETGYRGRMHNQYGYGNNKRNDFMIMALASPEGQVEASGKDDGEKNGDKTDGEMIEDMKTLGFEDMSEATMSELFHWAIENSDPEVLQAQAREGPLSSEDIVQRRMKMKKVLKEMDERPNEGQLMGEIIIGLKERGLNITEPNDISADIFSLEFLQELVEPIDNANDLDTMGGLDEVLLRIDSKHADIRQAAYHVLGTASSNNDIVQNQIVSKNGVRQMVRRLKVENERDAIVKGLYALGAVVRNNELARQAVYDEDFLELLTNFMLDDDPRILKKCASMVADFYARDPDVCSKKIVNVDMLIMSLINTIVESSFDLDLREKAMTAIHTMVTGQHLGAQGFESLQMYNIVGALEKFKGDVLELNFEGTDDPENPLLDVSYVDDLLAIADGILMHMSDYFKRKRNEL